MSLLGATFPGNVFFTGTVTSPQFVSNQQVIAPVASGTASTLTTGSITGTFCSITNASFANTLSAISGTLGSLTFGSFMGINTATPAYGLDIAGSTRIGSISNTSAGTASALVVNVPSVSFPVQSQTYTALNAPSAAWHALDWYHNAPANAAVTGPAARLLVSDSAYSADIRFQSKISGAFANTLTERLTILANGNVGLNNPTPSYTLDVNGNTRITGSNCLMQSAQPVFFLGTALATTQSGYINFNNTGSGATNGMGLGIYGVANDRITISSAGNIGINNINPQNNLDVAGSARVSGSLTISVSSGNSSLSALTCGIGTFSNLSLYPSLGNSYFNALTQTGDVGLICGSINSGTVGMVIGPWCGASAGLRIASVGTACNIGVNTSSPQYTLDVSGSARITGNFGIGTIDSANASYPSGILTVGNGTNTLQLAAAYGTSYGSVSHIIAFNAVNSVKYPLCLNGFGGNVGINTTAPAYQLDVAGTRPHHWQCSDHRTYQRVSSRLDHYTSKLDGIGISFWDI